jgi:hypothetical protein
LFQPVSDAVRFTDEGSGVPYQDIEIRYGSELLANRSEVTSSAGSAVAENATSVAVYGVTERNIETLLATTGELQGLADYVVARYGEPEYRIERITVNLSALPVDDVVAILSLELGDQADVIFTPNRVGEKIAVRNRVIGISHEVTVEQHIVSFSFEELPFAFFILDDALFGTLDNTDGVLGF